MPEGYDSIAVPSVIKVQLDAFVKENELGFRSRAEVMATALREFLARRESRTGEAVFVLGLLVAIPDAEIYRARDLVAKGRADEAVAHLATVLRAMERRDVGPARTPPRATVRTFREGDMKKRRGTEE